jgi:hypothetical protein
MYNEKFHRFEFPKVLAALIIEREDYSHVDKIGYAQSKDLLMFHVREALRDLQTLIRSGSLKQLNVPQIDYERIEWDLKKIADIETSRELREVASFIAGEALALAAKSITKQEKTNTKEEKA